MSENNTGITLKPAAVEKAAALLAAEEADTTNVALRIAVQPGGCSGLRYQLQFDDQQLEGDVFDDYDGIRLVVDKLSQPYLNGATIDFVDTIQAQGFTIDNPNAQNTCACGDSFH
uniref:HesB/IscA family protein n=1 Tax=Vaginimicrobium propionicum TaxID=1871034 RepID=UPI0009705C6D|nr:iron-sulfur cluster assembly accessory protein [Vaginimicrobium propionicum]